MSEAPVFEEADDTTTPSGLALAPDSVVVRRDTLTATGTRAVFDDKAERGWLFGNPRAWDDETTVTGDLSSRSPRHVGWRIRPSRVHSENATSPTSVGDTQCAPLACARGTSSAKGGVRRSSRSSRAPRSAKTRSLNPVPTCPA